MRWTGKMPQKYILPPHLSNAIPSPLLTSMRSTKGNFATGKGELFTCHLNCKYHPGGLIDDMQMRIYNRKHYHALSHSLHCVRQEGRLTTHPPSRASKSGSSLPTFNSVCLGLVPGQIDFPYLIIMS